MYTGLGGWPLRLAAADLAWQIGRTLADPGGFSRTPPPDPPGPRTDPGRARHRTIRTPRTGGAHTARMYTVSYTAYTVQARNTRLTGRAIGFDTRSRRGATSYIESRGNADV